MAEMLPTTTASAIITSVSAMEPVQGDSKFPLDHTRRVVADTTPVPSVSESALANLPLEINVEIFKNLDLVSAICLGLTSKRFYSILKLVRPTFRFDLNEWDGANGDCLSNQEKLASLLSTWKKPLVFSSFYASLIFGFKFVTQEEANKRKERLKIMMADLWATRW